MTPEPAPPEKPSLAPASRGISLLLIAYLVTMATSIIAGAIHAYLLDRLLHHGVSIVSGGLPLGIASTGWQVSHVVAALLSMVALAELGKSPRAARVASPSSTALILTVVSMVLSLLMGAISTALRSVEMSPAELARVMTGIGMVDAAVHGFSVVMIIEVLLRLRRYAAPQDREIEQNEGLWRGGLVAALVARTLIAYTAAGLAPILFHGAISNEWGIYFLRLPFAIVFYGAMLWLLQSTAKLVRQ